MSVNTLWMSEYMSVNFSNTIENKKENHRNILEINQLFIIQNYLYHISSWFNFSFISNLHIFSVAVVIVFPRCVSPLCFPVVFPRSGLRPWQWGWFFWGRELFHVRISQSPIVWSNMSFSQLINAFQYDQQFRICLNFPFIFHVLIVVLFSFSWIIESFPVGLRLTPGSLWTVGWLNRIEATQHLNHGKWIHHGKPRLAC